MARSAAGSSRPDRLGRRPRCPSRAVRSTGPTRQDGRMTQHADDYQALRSRYSSIPYRRCGASGLDLPAVSLGLWHNFGDDVPLDSQRATLRRAFDLGVTHFDLANNYGPPYGSAERNFGTHLRPGLPALPRRADHLDQGRLRHVARPLRPGRRLAQVRARLARPVPGADGPRLRRHLLLAPVRRRRRRSRRRWARSTPRSAGQGALRRHLVVLGPRTQEAVDDPAPSSARRCSSTSPPTRCSTAGSRRTCSTSSAQTASAASRSRRSPRAC